MSKKMYPMFVSLSYLKCVIPKPGTVVSFHESDRCKLDTIPHCNHSTELYGRPIELHFPYCCNYSTYLYHAAYVLSLASESRLSKKKKTETIQR